MSQAAEIWTVVVNDEEQYSVWLAERAIPDGWRAVGTEGTREECLAHIEQVWTDMRPRSLRESMRQRTSAPARHHHVD